MYSSERGGEFSEADRGKIEALVARMEAEMKAAAKQLEFERAAALRDEVQQIRLRVLEQDASVTVVRAAERAARDAAGRGLTGAADRNRGRRSAEAAAGRPAMEVLSVEVLPADEELVEPDATGIDEGTVADWLPGIRDEHEDTGRGAAWRDRPTWDHTVTPNVIKPIMSGMPWECGGATMAKSAGSIAVINVPKF